MVKIRHISVLLILILLLLLVISCGSGSKAGANTRAGVKPVSGAGTNTRTGVNPRTDKELGAVTGSGVNPRTDKELGAVIGSGVKPGTDKELDAVTVIDERTAPKTEEETEPNTDAEVGDEEALAYVNNISDPRLQALLDNFGVSGIGRNAIIYMQRILTVDDIYDRLNELGADVTIEKIIKPTVSFLRTRGKALRVIEGTTDEGVKTRLQDMFRKV
ncbi:hypothetical protein BPA_0041500 (plasmid) [Borrelia parkeri SLO]|uniref:Uncharacterized protein n=1 Tax=Borrelia parkeri SLO TaxID=1313294 RepID=W5SRZ3_BORPR|nr:hypothetical protein [Borrelia parkeri]AHH09959.1 hypothetical protein BPA_0041500 [Borrelia parkeri SLO]